jgi:4-diphosphocytidyl-2-C-methyl-D-erythritol kinase
MSAAVRRVRVPAFAKINLSLLVLHKRTDGYHEIRTVLQTVSLADSLDISFEPGRGASVELHCAPSIPDNLAQRAAERFLDAARVRGTVRILLRKRIPMGAGMGGGSADAAAVLLALGPLAGRALSPGRLQELAAGIGSDVPFFLTGGTAIGIGRGEEVYPIAGPRVSSALIVKPAVSVDTAGAYAALGRPAAELTSSAANRRIEKFQELVCALDAKAVSGSWQHLCENDFEAAIYPRSTSLPSVERLLRKLGAAPVRMTGSGSALFAVFSAPEQRNRAVREVERRLPDAFVRPVRFLERQQYRRAWWRALGPWAEFGYWPPRPAGMKKR